MLVCLSSENPPELAKTFKRSQPSQYGEIGLCHRRRKNLVPHLKRLVKPVTPCVYTQTNAPFFVFFFGPPRRQDLCSHF